MWGAWSKAGGRDDGVVLRGNQVNSSRVGIDAHRSGRRRGHDAAERDKGLRDLLLNDRQCTVLAVGAENEVALGIECRRVRAGGEGEIRTHEPREGLPVFKTGAFNRSATSPSKPRNVILFYSSYLMGRRFDAGLGEPARNQNR